MTAEAEVDPDEAWSRLTAAEQTRIVELLDIATAGWAEGRDARSSWTPAEAEEFDRLAAKCSEAIPDWVGDLCRERWLARRCWGDASRLHSASEAAPGCDGWCRLTPAEQRRALQLADRMWPFAVFSGDPAAALTQDELDEWYALVSIAGRMPDWLADIVQTRGTVQCRSSAHARA